MPNVFVVNDSGHDFSKAEEFGEIVMLTEGIIGKFQITSMFRIMEEHLKDSKSNDYIIMCGPSIMQSVACSIFAAKHGCLNLLLFKTGSEGDRGHDTYIFRRLNLSQLKEGDQNAHTEAANLGSPR